MLELYRNIKALRLRVGMTQTELAHKVGYADKSAIAKIEAGKVDLTQSKIIEFANALGTTASALLGNDGCQNGLNYNNKLLWDKEVGIPNFTTEEMNELINFAKYLISKRK